MPLSPKRIPKPETSQKESSRGYPEPPKPTTVKQSQRPPTQTKPTKNVPLTPTKNTPSTPKSELVKNIRYSHQMSAPRAKPVTPQPQKIKEKKRLTLNLEATDQTKCMKTHVLEFKNNLYKLVGSLNVLEQIFLSLHGLELKDSDKKYDTIIDKVLVKFNQVFENFVVDLFFSDHFQLIERIHSICYHKGEVNYKELVTKNIKNVMASDFKELFLKRENEKKEEEKKKLEKEEEKITTNGSVKSYKSKTVESTAPVEMNTKSPSKRGSRIGPADQIRDAIFAARRETLKRRSYNVPKRNSEDDGALFSQEIRIPQEESLNGNEGVRELTESYYSMAEEENLKNTDINGRDRTASPKKRPGHGQDRQDIENQVDKFPEMRNYAKKTQPNLDVRKKLDFEDTSKKSPGTYEVEKKPSNGNISVKRPSHIPEQKMEESYFRTRPTSFGVDYRKQPEFTPSKGENNKVEEMKEKLSALVNQKTPVVRNCARFSPAPKNIEVKNEDHKKSVKHHQMISDLIALPTHLQTIQKEVKIKSPKNEEQSAQKEQLKKYERPHDDDEDENPIRVDVEANHKNQNLRNLLEKRKNKSNKNTSQKKNPNIKSPFKDQIMAIPRSIPGSPEYQREREREDSFMHSGINLLKYGSEFVNSEIERTPENHKYREKSRTKKQDVNENDWTSMINEKEEDELTLGDKSIIEPHPEDKNGGNSFVSPNKSMKSYLEENDIRNFGKSSAKKTSKGNKSLQKENRAPSDREESPEDLLSRKSANKEGAYNNPQTPEKKERKIPEHTYRSDSMTEDEIVQVRKTKTKIVEDLIESFTKEVELEILGNTDQNKIQISFTEKEKAVRKKYKDEQDDLGKFSFLPQNMNQKYLKSSPINNKTPTETKIPNHVNYDIKIDSRRQSSNTKDVSPIRGWRDSKETVTPNRTENVREKISIMGKAGTSVSRPYQFTHTDTVLGYDKTAIPKLNTNSISTTQNPYSNNISSSITGRSTYTRNLTNAVPGLKNLTSGYGNSTTRYSNYSNIYNPSSITSRHTRNRTLDDNTLSSYRASSNYKKPDPMKYRIVNGKVEYLNNNNTSVNITSGLNN